MKFRDLILTITVTVVTAITIPTGLAAQGRQDHHKHLRYTVINLGTLLV
jgi:hypothetical protein